MDTLLSATVTNNTEISAIGSDVFVNIVQAGRSAGIFYSANGGGSWTPMDLPRTAEGTAAAIATLTTGTPIGITTGAPHGLNSGTEVQIAGVTTPAVANGVFTITVTGATTFTLDGSAGGGGLWSSDGTWQKVVGLNPKQKAGSQGFIHASIRQDPADTDMVYVGGDRQDNPFPNSIGALDFSGRLFRGDPTVTATGAIPSPQWSHITHSNTSSNSAPHADSREIVFDAAGNLIEVDDGGIYKRTTPSLNTGDWFSLNGNLQVTEQHDVAYDSLNDIIISGNQDTGTTQQLTSGGLKWDSVSTADGGDVVVDDSSTAGKSFRYSSFQSFLSFTRREYDSSNTLVSTTVLSPIASPVIGDGQFVTPLALNATDQKRMIIGGSAAVYESPDAATVSAATFAATLTTVLGSAGGANRNAMAYGHVSDPDLILIGDGSAVEVRPGPVGSLMTPTLVPFPDGDVITDVVLDPAPFTGIPPTPTFFVSAGSVVSAAMVWMTPDGGTGTSGTPWFDLTGNLPALGVNNVQQLEYLPVGATVDALVAATNNGVFFLPETAAGFPASAATGMWMELGAGLPNGLAFDLDYDPADDVLVVGTMGRGAWLLPGVSAAVSDPQLDFGDVPDSYATLLASAGPGGVGAHHTIGGPLLGALVDAEPDAALPLDSTGDDASPPGADDEDGVVIAALTAGALGAATVTVLSGPAKLNAWIDFDGDGVFTPGGAEEIASDLVVNTGPNAVSFPVPAGAVTGTTTYARFRLSTAGALPPTGGPAPDGEVEDYSLTISGPTLDFGDAPNTYLTTLGVGGARHTAIGPLLGSFRDTEFDANAPLDGTGDDVTGFPDDEDGVTFPGLLVVGTTSSVLVTSAVGGTLDYFFDFDASGVFGDAAGEVFTFAHPGGGTVSVPVVVPAGAAVGSTYARFRLNSGASVGPAGPAADGEVEDYSLTISSVAPTLDFGDAPNTYLTTLGVGGARHTAIGPLLGTVRDAELDANAPLNGTGDDVTGVPDDEDGVTSSLAFTEGAASTISIVHSATGTVDIWIDTNGSGTFDASEKGSLSVVGAGTVSVTFMPPAGSAAATGGTTYARFRINSGGTLGPAGLAADGEVEDYTVTIDPPQFDFGDAPDTYLTTLGAGGARHTPTGPLLGTVRDAELDANAPLNGTGDDVTGVPDDEDGVTSSLAFTEGAASTISIVHSATGTVDIWIDTNGSGTFDAFEKASATVLGAGTVSVTFMPPAGSAAATGGTTYARFRINSGGTLGPAGLAADGEVEDYFVTIEPALDYGDAPDSYLTLAASGGPSHVIVPGMFMGIVATDPDIDGFGDGTDSAPVGDAMDDDLKGSTPDDEDGVISFAASPVTFGASLIVTSGPAATLYGWVDFDGDGFFQADEGASTAIPAGSSGLVTGLAWTGLGGSGPDIVLGSTFARFRLTSDPSITTATPGGPALDGEVEDYPVVLTLAPPLDYGDAPDSYSTLHASGGARHVIASGMFMGAASPDVDTDGFGDGTDSAPVGNAMDDDLKGSTPDDEDGVASFATLLATDTTYSTTVTVTSGPAATLRGWIDFDGDGTFQADESTSAAVGAGSSGAATVLTWTGLGGAGPDIVAGSTYARFRLTDDSAITAATPGGGANSGEVEDYTLEIVEAMPNIVFISSDTAGVVAGIEYANEDILAYDVDNDKWSMYFDGSRVGVIRSDVDAFHIRDDGTILMSFDIPTTLPVLGRVEDADIVRFTPSGLGVNTAGTFAWFLDGSDVGLRSTQEDINAISFTPTGDLVVSTARAYNVPTATGNITGSESELILLVGGVFGENSAGTWQKYFDAADVGLTQDLWGASIEANGDIDLTPQGSFTVGAISGTAQDIVTAVTPVTGEPSSAASLDLLFDGAAAGLVGAYLDGIQRGTLTGSESFGSGHIYLSSDNNPLIAGMSWQDDDIYVQDLSTGKFSLYFDGSDVGVTGDVDGFHIQPNGDILMSFKAQSTISGLGTVKREDIVRFTPTSIGDTTAGSFAWFLDGSDVGLSGFYENIDAIAFTPGGDLLVSTVGNYSVPGNVGTVTGTDKDLIALKNAVFGANSSGTWEKSLDGSSIGLNSTSEDITGAWVHPGSGSQLLNTLGTLSIPGLSGGRADIFASGAADLFYDGRAAGIGNQLVDGIFIDIPQPSPIAGRYFEDADGNNVDNGIGLDPGVVGQTVRLFEADGVTAAKDIFGRVVSAVQTGADGIYRFDWLAARRYVVKFAKDADRDFVLQDFGSDDTIDSDADEVTGNTGLVEVETGLETANVDAAIMALTPP